MSELTGTVKFFNTSKGYGFIKPDSGEKDLFVHINNVKPGNVLEDGCKVAFTIIEDKRGPAAGNVEVI